MPTTTAAGTSDLEDRITRGRATAVVTTPDQTWKFDGIAPDLTRISVGEADGWEDMHAAYAIDVPPTPHRAPRPAIRSFYFTSGTTSRPNWWSTPRSAIPGHLSTMYWLGLRPGDVHLNISSPASQACVVLLLRAVDRRGHDLPLQLHPLRRGEPAHRVARSRGHEFLRAAHGLANAHQRRPLRRKGQPARGDRCRRATQPRGHRAGRRGVGLILRDGYGQTEMTAAVGNTPGSVVKAGSMGRPLPGMPVALVDPATGEVVVGPGEGRSAWTSRSTRCR
jgi:acetyl-CoA synthetase